MRLRPPAAARFTVPRASLRIAHRGASASAPENTLAAFAEAVRLGVDAIELDVHLSADGVPVVIHDETVDRTTDGRGAVASLPYATLKRLDAGSWFAPRFRGERIPSLDDTLDWAFGRTGLNIEMKAKTADGGRRARGLAPVGLADLQALAGAVARSLKRVRFRGLLLLSSFDPRALILAREALPRARLGLLASRSARDLERLHRRVGLFALHAHSRLASSRLIRKVHARGLAVLVWPVNGIASMRRFLARGADGLMTDDPGLFRML